MVYREEQDETFDHSLYCYNAVSLYHYNGLKDEVVHFKVHDTPYMHV